MEFQTYSLCPGSSKHLVSRFSFLVPNCTASEQLALEEAEVEDLREGEPAGRASWGGAWFCVRMPGQGPRREWCPCPVHEDRRLIHCKPSTDVPGGGGGIRATFTNHSWVCPLSPSRHPLGWRG